MKTDTATDASVNIVIELLNQIRKNVVFSRSKEKLFNEHACTNSETMMYASTLSVRDVPSQRDIFFAFQYLACADAIEMGLSFRTKILIERN